MFDEKSTIGIVVGTTFTLFLMMTVNIITLFLMMTAEFRNDRNKHLLALWWEQFFIFKKECENTF